MRITIAAVGRWKTGPERELYELYISRLPWSVELKEIEVKKELNTKVRRSQEGTALLGAIPTHAHIIALDERGTSETSERFAARLSECIDTGNKNIVFLIGGADGLEESLRKRANAVLSFGALTWPHMLVRTLLAEQLYRAHSIMTGHPYHRA